MKRSNELHEWLVVLEGLFVPELEGAEVALACLGVALDDFIEFLRGYHSVLEQHNRLLLEHSLVVLAFWAYVWLVLGVNGPADDLDTLTFAIHHQFPRVPLECVPDPSVVVSVLRHNVRVRECLELRLLVPRVVTGCSHVSSCEVKVLIGT